VNSLRVWRLCPATYAADPFSGVGGLYFPARWHNKGRRIVYTAESRSLAALEILANSHDRAAFAARPWVLAWADIPLPMVENPATYPDDWRAHPPPASTRAFGDAWLAAARSPALRVPSAVIAGEFNYLLNPAHPGFAQIRLGPPESFSFDPRLR